MISSNLREYLRKWIPLGIIIGLIGGVGAIAFQLLLDFFWFLSYESYNIPSYLIFLVPALGGLVVGLIIQRFAYETKGLGINQVIDSIHHSGGKIRPIVIPVKVVASALTIGLGGSAGREGPIAQIGAGLASFTGTKLKMTRSDLRIFVISGMAAGFSAIFKAPLGAAVFAMEMPYRNDLESNAVIPSIIASVVSYLVYVPLYGLDPVFSFPQTLNILSIEVFPYTILVGVITGIVGMVFVKTLHRVRDAFEDMAWPLYLKTGAGGLMVGILGLAVPEVLGLGRGVIQQMITGPQFPLIMLVALLVGKMVATSLTIGSGQSGGIFSSALLMGGVVGGLIGALFGTYLAPALVLVGMGAMMAGVTKTPVSTPIMITEMVGGYFILIPVMIGGAISYMITGDNTLYTSQITRKSFDLDISSLGRVRVEDIMVKDVDTIRKTSSLKEAREMAEGSPHYLYPVVTDDGKIIGVAPRERILEVGERLPKASVLQVLQTHFESIPSDREGLEAFDTMVSKQISRMIVVDPSEPTRVVGIITRADISRILEQLDERHHEF